MLESICLKPSGFVQEGISKPREPYRAVSRYDVVSTIRILEEYVEALEGLQEYQEYPHIIILYWVHEERSCRLEVRPRGVERYLEVGIFAKISPKARPYSPYGGRTK